MYDTRINNTIYDLDMYSYKDTIFISLIYITLQAGRWVLCPELAINVIDPRSL